DDFEHASPIIYPQQNSLFLCRLQVAANRCIKLRYRVFVHPALHPAWSLNCRQRTTATSTAPVESKEPSTSSSPPQSPTKPTSEENVTAPPSTSTDETSESQPALNLTLRLRNAKNELNDIRFDFKHGEDTPQGVAQELVSAGLINGVDVILVAANLEKALQSPAAYRHPAFMVFQLKTPVPSGQTKDEKTLIGFAQLTIN
ncbi:STE20 SPS1-related proline-alanine-rich kinase isoform X6, partial [Paramuricea clavata]